MSDRIVLTLRAERGKKYEETGECISSYNRSIVFLPHSVKPGEMVRVRLVKIPGKVDRNNQPLYRAELAPFDILQETKEVIAAEAEELLSATHFAGEAGVRLVAARGLISKEAESAALGDPMTPSAHFFFIGASVRGGAFPPAALRALRLITVAEGAGLEELIKWIYDPLYYQATQERGESPILEVPESALAQINEQAQKTGKVLTRDISDVT